jgi:hypothetical protein
MLPALDTERPDAPSVNDVFGGGLTMLEMEFKIPPASAVTLVPFDDPPADGVVNVFPAEPALPTEADTA